MRASKNSGFSPILNGGESQFSFFDKLLWPFKNFLVHYTGAIKLNHDNKITTQYSGMKLLAIQAISPGTY
jgi:hypothetical protein